jgi:hypothetical protein
MSASFPDSWAVNLHAVKLRYAVPKFHLPAHIKKCHQDYSFNYMKEVGRTDGEAPERGWAKINGLSHSTREMGPGSRQDTINDHFGDTNWKKVIGMGKHRRCWLCSNVYISSGSALSRKLKLAIPEKIDKHEDWIAFSMVLDPVQVAEWTKEVEAWESDPSCPNPFRSRVQGE